MDVNLVFRTSQKQHPSSSEGNQPFTTTRTATRGRRGAAVALARISKGACFNRDDPS